MEKIEDALLNDEFDFRFDCGVCKVPSIVLLRVSVTTSR